MHELELILSSKITVEPNKGEDLFGPVLYLIITESSVKIRMSFIVKTIRMTDSSK